MMGHKAAVCRIKLGQCYTCGNTGHIAANCPKSKGDSKGRPLHAVDPNDAANGDQVNQTDETRGNMMQHQQSRIGRWR